MAAAATTENNNAPAGGSGSGEQGGLMGYLRGVRSELKKAEWPTREQLIKLTQVVLLLIFVVAVYCGGLDFLLSQVTNRLFNRA